jgi:hypothetical protein
MGYQVHHYSTVTGFSARGVRCAHCGEEYVYDVRRDASGTAMSRNSLDGGAQHLASARAHDELSQKLQGAVDLVPCPTCGGYQPDMAAHMRRQRLRWLMHLGVFALLVAVAPAGMLLAGKGDRDSLLVTTTVTAGLGAVLLLLRAAFLAVYNPNGGDPEPRMQQARCRAYRPADIDQLVRDRQRQPVARTPGEVGSRPLGAAIAFWVFAAIFLIASLCTAVAGVETVREADASLKWPTANGQVIQAFREVIPTSRRPSVTLHWHYSYTVAGENFLSSKLRFGLAPVSEETLQRYPRGASLNVYYKPGNPSVAVLEPGAHFPDSYVLVVVAAVLLMIGFGLLGAGGHKYRRYRQLQDPWRSTGPTWREGPAPAPPPANLPIVRI